MLKAVIFDCDGVIAESEISRFRHIKQLAEEKGYTGLELKKHAKHTIGKQTKDILKTVFGKRMKEEEMEEIAKKRREDMEKAPEKFIKAVEGIKEACERLANVGYTLAVASTAQKQTVDATIKHLGLSKYFKAITTGSEVKNKKPDPEVYIKALEKLNIKKEEAVAVEDSETGVEAAKGAGLKVVGLRNKEYQTYGHTENLAKADAIIDNLNELPAKIKEMTK